MNADLGGEDSRWQVVEDGFDPALANTYETLFTTGNGYLGTRGSLEEGHEGALPGTFLRGVFDHHDSAVIDLVKAPDWVESGRRGQRRQAGRHVAPRSSAIDGYWTCGRARCPRDRVRGSAGPTDPGRDVRFASSADQHLCCLRARDHAGEPHRADHCPQRHRRHGIQPGSAAVLRRAAAGRPTDEVAQVGQVQAPRRGGPRASSPTASIWRPEPSTPASPSATRH